MNMQHFTQKSLEALQAAQTLATRSSNQQLEQAHLLRAMLEDAGAGAVQTHKAVDAILAQTAVTYGERVLDEETGAAIGRRLTIPLFDVDDVLGKYEVRTRRDETDGTYVVGVVQRLEA